MRQLVTLVVVALAAVALTAGPAAAKGKPAGTPDTACLQAGISVLQANGGVAYFARNGVPLSLIGGEGTAPLPTVLQLHLTSPELFPWC
ncbi:MAG TPA: hypothetical protein VK915_14065 [Gaiellaceae bacterium]|nr:hypothetical protein [Gaiellaceae bacterium]